MAQQAGVRLERAAKRVRTYLGGELVADTTRPWLVWEIPYYPSYYLPVRDVRARLVPTGAAEPPAPSADPPAGWGEPSVYDVAVGQLTAPAAARRYLRSSAPELRDLVRFEWSAMDEWFEEDEPVYTHPRDPYIRVDIVASSRHVRVEVDRLILADSRSPRVLFETGLPPRYYLPMPDVRLDLLRQSPTLTHCPYKGTASYWSLDAGGRQLDDLMWVYRSPLPESQKVAGLACFYNERVELYVDGVLQEQPRTRFS